MTRQVFVHRIETASPDDMSGLEAAFAEGSSQRGAIVVEAL